MHTKRLDQRERERERERERAKLEVIYSNSAMTMTTMTTMTFVFISCIYFLNISEVIIIATFHSRNDMYVKNDGHRAIMRSRLISKRSICPFFSFGNSSILLLPSQIRSLFSSLSLFLSLSLSLCLSLSPSVSLQKFVERLLLRARQLWLPRNY